MAPRTRQVKIYYYYKELVQAPYFVLVHVAGTDASVKVKAINPPAGGGCRMLSIGGIVTAEGNPWRSEYRCKPVVQPR
jgi:hypothetical protein